MEGGAPLPPDCWLFPLDIGHSPALRDPANAGRLLDIRSWICSFFLCPVPLGYWIFSRPAGSRECGTVFGYSFLNLTAMSRCLPIFPISVLFLILYLSPIAIFRFCGTLYTRANFKRNFLKSALLFFISKSIGYYKIGN